ncbi:hypothetical protein C6A85_28550, partial [Mycobacterium sp. ITM-2017-0098]
ADNPSVARTVGGWLFEVPYILSVIIWSVLAHDKLTKRRDENAQRLRQLAESGLVYELQPGVFRHGTCTINHRTTDTAERCKAKT